MSGISIAAVWVACLVASAAAAQRPSRPEPSRPETPVAVTFRGACGAAWRDSVDRTAECERTQRPVCYSNGACRCEDDTRCR